MDICVSNDGVVSKNIVVLPEEIWTDNIRDHEIRIDQFMKSHLERRSRNQKDPVTDFIFEYYNFRPAHLRRWSPGIGVVLGGPGAHRFLQRKAFEETARGVQLSPEKFPDRLRKSTRWIRDLLVATQNRTPYFGCSGMHEWALIYGSDPIRHTDTPLRLNREEINNIVDCNPTSCTHFDAFRFFTAAARPKNASVLTRDGMVSTEQPGCLHTNMDVFKWAFKRYPWIPSDLVSDAFFLANKIRRIDMRASPYDLSSSGLEPIPVETPDGRRLYRDFQRDFFVEAHSMRARLISAYDQLLSTISEPVTELI